jgi:hypothetical protein
MRKMLTPGSHLGFFAHHHLNPPPPFNPLADPQSERRYAQVTASLVADAFYDHHDREDCKAEWARRYETLRSSPILATLDHSRAILRNHEEA